MENDQWKRLEGQLKEQLREIVKPLDSDGYATGLVALVLEESGADRQDQELRRALDWLDRHQRSDGSWQAYSLNEKRDPQSDIGRFMSDAATAYAAMALDNGRLHPAGK
jgi:hypothetical protein